MSKKPRTERIRQQDANRQQAKRDREKARREAVDAKVVKIEMYAGTRRDLTLMQQVGGYQEPDEALTLAIRYMAGMARRDPAAFLQAMDPRSPA